MVDIYRCQENDLSYTFRKIPQVDVALVKIDSEGRRATAIPGISWSAGVEIILFKDDCSLTRNLSELGECFVVDSYAAIPDSRVAGKIGKALYTETDWDIKKVYYAVPLEMAWGGMYRMASSLSHFKGPPLFKCSSATLFDSEVGSFNCLEACLYQIDYLMGVCQLGMPRCAEGLHHHVSTNQETASK